MSTDNFDLETAVEDLDEMIKNPDSTSLIDLPDWLQGDGEAEKFCTQVVEWLKELKSRREKEAGSNRGLYLL